jgi:hypothetical protein
MKEDNWDPVRLERAAEQLRQEKEAFESARRQDSLWFNLRLVMGYASIVLLISIMLIASYILLNSDRFPKEVLISAGAALFTDILGLLLGVWKIVLNPKFHTGLAPTTNIDNFININTRQES